MSISLRAALAALLAAAIVAAPCASATEGVVVTASRLQQNVDDTLASVTLLERADIERLQARTLDEVLAGVEGVNIARSGGVGQPTSVFLRGGNSAQTLWLVDGVRIGSVTAGIPAIQDLPLDTIERIEIVRGPRSSLYGPDAMAGIVQIFTRRGASAAPTVRLTTGSHGTRQASAGFGLGDESAWADIQLSHLATDGTNACAGAPFPPGGGCFTNEPDRDPYRNSSVNVRAGTRLADGTQLEAFAQRAKAHVAFDSSFLNESDLRNQIVGTTVRGTWLDGVRSVLTLGRADDQSISLRRGVTTTSRFDSRRFSATWQNDFSATGGEWVAGLDWLRDEVDSSTRYTVDARRNRAAFLQYSTARGPYSLGVSGRYDENQQFGGHSTGSLALGFRFAAGMQLYASIANAFRAPTFNDLYYPLYGNPSLSPERSVTSELGLKHHPAWGRWSVAVYRSAVDDLVAFDTKTYLPKNIARARLTGVDANIAWRFGAFRLEQSLGWLDAIDRSAGVPSGRELPRRPHWSGKSTLAWRGGDFDLAGDLRFAGGRFDDLANRIPLGAYTVVDLAATYRASPIIDLQFRLANALDRRYETTSLYPALGREAFFTIRYHGTR